MSSEEAKPRTTFGHSIKVPRLYKEAAKAYQKVEGYEEGFKSSIHSAKHPNMKGITALVSTTLRHRILLDVVIAKAKLVEKEPRLSLPLAKVLITELLWGKKRLGGEAKPIKTILSYKEKFEKILVKHARKHNLGDILSEGGESTRNNQQFRKPRYVRVNTLVKTLDEVLDQLTRVEGWRQVDHTNCDELELYDFFIDPFVENLLVFRAGTEFHQHQLYLDGSVVLQDKASCLPALALKPRRGKVALDACAAPGMKTSHLAALMQNEGTIYAVEKNPGRFETLNTMMEYFNVTCVKPVNADFSDLLPTDYPDVEYIIVDPSCTGSGMTNRVLEGLTEEGKEIECDRLQKLSYYQSRLVLHAMKFPNVKKIVFSTCSIHREENEDVIAIALAHSEQRDEFRLVNTLSNWPHRSSCKMYEWSDNCVKSDFENDRTDGFFVAVLQRIKNMKVKHEECNVVYE